MARPKMDQMVDEIKIDLGCDINSLGIKDRSIRAKINEALRKVSAYAPKMVIESYPGADVIEMPEGTSAVVEILSDDISKASSSKAGSYNDINIFAGSLIGLNQAPQMDPYMGLMYRSGAKTMQGYYNLRDWFYVKETRKLYLNNPPANVTVKYFLPYDSLEEVKDPDILQTIKEYALALCKIIEGNIRRKLSSAPGAIQMDGDRLVSEGQAEKAKLDDWIPKQYANLRFGLRV